MPVLDIRITICESRLPHDSPTGRVVDVMRRREVRQDAIKGGGDGRDGLTHEPLAPVWTVKHITQVIRFLQRYRDMP